MKSIMVLKQEAREAAESMIDWDEQRSGLGRFVDLPDVECPVGVVAGRTPESR